MATTIDRHTPATEIISPSSVLSSHATSEGLVVYYRRPDGSVGVALEPRPVMPKYVVLDRTA